MYEISILMYQYFLCIKFSILMFSILISDISNGWTFICLGIYVEKLCQHHHWCRNGLQFTCLNKIRKEKARWELHKNATHCFEQILEATRYKTLAVHLLTSHLTLFTNPSAQAGCDTRSIFKRSLTGLNSEFSFS